MENVIGFYELANKSIVEAIEATAGVKLWVEMLESLISHSNVSNKTELTNGVAKIKNNLDEAEKGLSILFKLLSVMSKAIGAENDNRTMR